MKNIEQNDNIDCTRIRTAAELNYNSDCTRRTTAELNYNSDCTRRTTAEQNEELLTAIENNNLEQVKSLVEQGVDVNYKDEDDDWTPLMYAVMSSISATIIPYNLEIIKYLIDKGADVNAKDSNGDAVLLYAINKGELNLVKLLIENGADIEVEDKFGYTALMIACERNFEIAKFLIDNGADVNAKSKYGKRTPLILCCDSRENWKIPDYKVLELVKYLIECGADVNAKDSSGETALMYAVLYDKKEVVKFLIYNGADVNSKDSDGRTPLMVASDYARFEIAKLLIINGADVNAKDNNGKTLLMYAKNVEMKNCLKRAMGKRKLSQSTLPQSIEKIKNFIDCDYLDFNQLKIEVAKLNQATSKTMDLSLALQKKVMELQEDSFLNAQRIQVIENTHQMQIDKIYSILKKHIVDTDNFVAEFAEKYDKKNKQKGFIRRFFDKVAKFFGTISNSAEPNTSILKSQLSNETIPQNSSECQEQDNSGDESNESTHTRRKP